jgi:hypothetical protein
MGTSVPSAVVATATAIRPAGGLHAGRFQPEACDRPEDDGDPPADRSARQQPPRDAAVDHLDAGEEEEDDEPEAGEELDVRVGLGDVENLGPDEDAQENLDHHGREDEPRARP